MKIDSNIPLPEPQSRHSKYRAILLALKPGESVVFPQKSRPAVTNAARVTGKEFTTRRIDDATMRVWCVSEAKK